MSSVIRRLFKMSALRQAMALSLSFLVFLGTGGVVLEYLLIKELRIEIDDDLKRDFATISRDIQATGALPESFAHSEPLASLEASLGFLQSDRVVLGPVNASVFSVNGLQTFEDEELFPTEILQILRDAIEAMDSGDDDLDTETLPFNGDFDTAWRVMVGPVMDGKLVVYAPTLSDLGLGVSAIIFFVVIFLSILTLIFGIVFGLRAQRRLDRIGRGFELLADGDLTVRLAPKVVKDDLDLLAVRIDGATERLQSSLHQMSEFSANIAHDLRTPLTRLRVHLDQASEAKDQEAHLENSIAQTNEIISIFDAIQRIARLRTGERRAKFQPLDLGEIAQQAHDVYEAVAEDEERTLTFMADNPIMVTGDRSLLTQLLANLIENAIRHTEAGATVAVNVTGSTLTVADDGPGIPKKDRSKVLEPLYRLDSSRNSPGAGLGLSMVKAIADLHGATLILSDTRQGESRGLSVHLDFKDGIEGPVLK
jgi:signal transduction histidine kinase